jgi:hypothetical protein
MVSGRISLVYKGQILKSLTYSNSNRRRTIVATWKMLYGKAFSPEMLQDARDQTPAPRRNIDSRTPFNNAILR